jgi:hypothetical protein
MPDDPMVLAVAALAVVLLLTIVVLWRTRRQLAVVKARARGSVDDLTDLFSDLNDLRITVGNLIHPAIKPAVDAATGPIAMPVTVSTVPGLGWVDEPMGQQPVPDPDPDPPTTEIPRVSATRHNRSEPKTTTISVAEIAARLKAEQPQETE